MVRIFNRTRKVLSPKDQQNAILSDPYLLMTYMESIETVENFASKYLERPINDLKVLDLGAAGGITKVFRPEWITCDLRESPGVDFLIDSDMKIPLQDSSIDVIFLQDALHHIQNLNDFSIEASRLLTRNGIIICREPSWTFPAQLVWRFFHPEDFSLRKIPPFLRGDFKFSPMEGNQAIPWYLSKLNSRSSKEKPLLLKDFQMSIIGWANGIAFLLSGGSNFTSNIDRKLLIKLHKLELKSQIWRKLFGFSVWLVFERNPLGTKNK